MCRLVTLFFLCCSFSASAQIYLDSLPLTPPALMFPATPIEVGYGHQELRAFNGAATHLDASRFNRGQIYDVNQLWQAQVPGFTVTRPGSNPNEPMDTRIRGLRTFSLGQTTPLYVVDGVPGVDPFTVEPSDVVAVDVLRDAASTAIYGGRGTGGVVLITTRPGSDPGPLQVRYQGQVSVEAAARRYELLDADAFIAAGGVDLSPKAAVHTDWQDQVLQTALGHAHHLTANKSGRQGFIRAGLHYRDVKGIVRESDFEQYNGSLLAGRRFWHDRLAMSAGATMGQRNSNYGFSESYRYAISYNPSAPIRSDEPEYQPFGGYVETPYFDYFNPVAIIEQNRSGGRTDYASFHARAELAILRHLTASLLVSEQIKTGHDLEYYSPYSKFRGAGREGFGLANRQKNRQKILESTFTYRFSRAGFQGELLGGYGWYHHQVDAASVSGDRLLDNTWRGKSWVQYRDLLKNFNDRSGYADYDVQSDRQLIAFFGRARLQWRDTYFGTVSWRKEGSSNLSPATRWGVFPAFSVGVDINQWMGARPFDYFKVSLGHGVTGSEITRSGLYQRTFGQTVKIFYNGQFIPAYESNQNPNPRLGWERTAENSLNLRLSMWNGRMEASVNAYAYRSRDLISNQYKPIPPNFASNTYENVGEIAGRGAELSLNYQLVSNQQLTWEMSAVANTSVSTLENTGFSADTVTYGVAGQPCGCGIFLQLLYPGAKVGTFWGPVVTGIDAGGQQTFEDINGNGVSSFNESFNYNQDQTRLGDAQPTWQLGLEQKITWRNLDLNMQLQAVTGHRIFHYYRYAYETNSSSIYNRVITRYYDPALKFTQFNDRMVENASFLRLQYVSLGYKLPLTNSKWISGLHFQIGVQNLFTLTKYTGLDPDLRLTDKGPTDNGGRGYVGGLSDPLLPGLDRGGTYPTARRWWLGVEAAF